MRFEYRTGVPFQPGRLILPCPGRSKHHPIEHGVERLPNERRFDTTPFVDGDFDDAGALARPYRRRKVGRDLRDLLTQGDRSGHLAVDCTVNRRRATAPPALTAAGGSAGATLADVGVGTAVG